MLSNILDYFDTYWGFNWSYENLKIYEDRLSSITNKDGLIYLKYFMYYIKNECYTRNVPFMSSDVTVFDFEEEIHKVKRNDSKAYDAVILKRVK